MARCQTIPITTNGEASCSARLNADADRVNGDISAIADRQHLARRDQSETSRATPSVAICRAPTPAKLPGAAISNSLPKAPDCAPSSGSGCSTLESPIRKPMNCAPIGNARTIIRASQPNHRPVMTSPPIIKAMLRPAAGTGGISWLEFRQQKDRDAQCQPDTHDRRRDRLPKARQQRHCRAHPGQHQGKSRCPVQQRNQVRIHDPPTATILSKTRWEKLESVAAMNGPSIIRARPIATTFGRKANVASLIWVIA